MSNKTVEILSQYKSEDLAAAKAVVDSRRLKEKLAERRRAFEARVCVRCGVEMFRPNSTIICDYMLKYEVWNSCGFAPNEVACLRCAEETLSRPLTIEDFLPTIINRTLLWCIGRNIRPWLDDR